VKTRTQLVGGHYNGVFRDIDQTCKVYEAGIYSEEGMRSPDEPPKNESFSIEIYTRRLFTHPNPYIFDIIVYGIKGMPDDDVWEIMTKPFLKRMRFKESI